MAKWWNQWHADPRWSYYLFLRTVYRMTASEAWREVQKWLRVTPPVRGAEDD